MLNVLFYANYTQPNKRVLSLSYQQVWEVGQPVLVNLETVHQDDLALNSIEVICRPHSSSRVSAFHLCLKNS